MNNDTFGDRIKGYESTETNRKLDFTLPIIARMDGRNFSQFAKQFHKPFDPRFSNAMRRTTQRLLDVTQATIGYTQSDEITLIFKPIEGNSEPFFGGRTHKLTSILASMTTAIFHRELYKELTTEHYQLMTSCGINNILDACPHFDSRIWSVPTLNEAANTLLWRAQDARKNGINSACRTLYSPKEMHGMKQEDMIEMMSQKGVDYYTKYSINDQLGTYYKHVPYTTLIDDDTWDKIPDIQKRNMGRIITRSRVKQLDIGYLGDIDNRVELIFGT